MQAGRRQGRSIAGFALDLSDDICNERAGREETINEAKVMKPAGRLWKRSGTSATYIKTDDTHDQFFLFHIRVILDISHYLFPFHSINGGGWEKKF